MTRGVIPQIAPSRMSEPDLTSLTAKQRFVELSVEKSGSYFEAQIHGGVRLENVEKVLFYKKDPSALLQSRLKKKGIGWEVVK
jgi:hypothetical protein